MIYFLIDEQRKENAIAHIQSLEVGDKWELVIQPKVKCRTKAQNRLFHMWIPYFGSKFGYTDKDMKVELKYAFLGQEERLNHRGVKRIAPIDTSDLSVLEFIQFLNELERFAINNEINLPIPDDYNFAMKRG